MGIRKHLNDLADMVAEFDAAELGDLEPERAGEFAHRLRAL